MEKLEAMDNVMLRDLAIKYLKKDPGTINIGCRKLFIKLVLKANKTMTQ